MKMMRFDCPPDLAQRFWVMCRSRQVTSGEMLRIIMVHELQKWELQTGTKVGDKKPKETET